MKGIKRHFTNRAVFTVLGLLTALFVGEVGAMRMSPAGVQRAKAFAAKNQGLQASGKTQRIETAVAQKAKILKPGEYFVHAKGMADGIVVTRDVLEKSPILKDMLEGTTWQQDHATIPLPFSADVIQKVFNLLIVEAPARVNALKESLEKLSLNQFVDNVNNIYALGDYLNLPQIMSLCSDRVIDRMMKIAKDYSDISSEYDRYSLKRYYWNKVSPIRFRGVFDPLDPKFPEYEALGRLDSVMAEQVVGKLVSNEYFFDHFVKSTFQSTKTREVYGQEFKEKTVLQLLDLVAQPVKEKIKRGEERYKKIEDAYWFKGF